MSWTTAVFSGYGHVNSFLDADVDHLKVPGYSPHWGPNPLPHSTRSSCRQRDLTRKVMVSSFPGAGESQCLDQCYEVPFLGSYSWRPGLQVWTLPAILEIGSRRCYVAWRRLVDDTQTVSLLVFGEQRISELPLVLLNLSCRN